MKSTLKDAGMTKISLTYIDVNGNMTVNVRIVPVEAIPQIISFVDDKAVA